MLYLVVKISNNLKVNSVTAPCRERVNASLHRSFSSQNIDLFYFPQFNVRLISESIEHSV